LAFADAVSAVLPDFLADIVPLLPGLFFLSPDVIILSVRCDASMAAAIVESLDEAPSDADAAAEALAGCVEARSARMLDTAAALACSAAAFWACSVLSVCVDGEAAGAVATGRAALEAEDDAET
jgi:hypothetical protein